MFEKWLNCQIYKGMFSDELVAEYGAESFFVPKNLVKREDENSHVGRLRVKSFKRDSTWFAVLPTNYQDTIAVKESDLVAA